MPLIPFSSNMNTWETWDPEPDNLSNKELKSNFFNGLYSLHSLSDSDPLEASEASLLLATSRDQRNKRLIRRSSHVPASSARPAPKMATQEVSAGSSTAPAAPAPRVSSIPPDSSRVVFGDPGKVVKRKRTVKVMPSAGKKRIFNGLYFCKYHNGIDLIFNVFLPKVELALLTLVGRFRPERP